MSNENSFRRKNSKGAKLIEEQKPQRDALSAAQDVQSEISNLTQVSSDQLEALNKIQTSLDNQEAASELSLEELNIISAEMKKLQEASRSGPTASQLSDLQSTIEIASDIRSDEHKETLEGFNDVQAALKALQNDASLKQVEFKAPQGFQSAPKVTPVINPVLPEPEPIKEDKADEMLPNKARDKEIGQASVIAGIMAQLKQMNQTMTGMASGISQMVFQMGLQTIKMGALVGAGLFAADIIIAGVKSIWSEYGDQIKDTYLKVVDKVTEAWDKLKGILPVEEVKRMLTNAGNLFQDFKNGELIDGLVYTFSDNMQNVVSIFARAIEGLFRAVGFDGTADKVVAARVQMNMDRGVKSSDEDVNIWAKTQSFEGMNKDKAYKKALKKVTDKYNGDSKYVTQGAVKGLTELGRAEVAKEQENFMKGKTEDEAKADYNVSVVIGKAEDAISGFDSTDRSEGRYNRMQVALDGLNNIKLSPEQQKTHQQTIEQLKQNINNYSSVIKENQAKHQAERDRMEGRGNNGKAPSIQNGTTAGTREVDQNINAAQQADAAKETRKNDALTNQIVATNVSNVKNTTAVFMAPQSSIPGIIITA